MGRKMTENAQISCITTHRNITFKIWIKFENNLPSTCGSRCHAPHHSVYFSSSVHKQSECKQGIYICKHLHFILQRYIWNCIVSCHFNCQAPDKHSDQSIWLSFQISITLGTNYIHACSTLSTLLMLFTLGQCKGHLNTYWMDWRDIWTFTALRGCVILTGDFTVTFPVVLPVGWHL